MSLTLNSLGGTGLRRVFRAILPQQSRSHLIEQLLDAAAILQGTFEYWHHGLGNIAAAPSTFFCEGQQIVGMLLTPGAGGTIGPDTGLIDQCQGSLQGGPASEELVAQALLNWRIKFFWLHRGKSTWLHAYNTVCILHTLEKNAPQSKSSAPAPRFTPAQLLGFLLQLLPRRALRRLPALQQATFYERLFTPLVTLWYLLFQWLNHDHTLEAVLTDARAGGADRLNPKLSRQLVSSSTGPYSDARTRLPEPFLAEALGLQGRQITQQSPTTLWKDMPVALLDGSTVRLRPYEDIPQEFAPHSNQHQKKTYWCLMRVVVSFCSLSAAALDCALGSIHRSEQALGCEIILRAVGHWLFLGDRNFGVFRLAQTARHVHQQVLLRMTEARAVKLLGAALRAGDFQLSWNPTRQDQLQAGCSPEPVQGRLIIEYLQRPGFRPQWLCLFTTLTDRVEYPPAELVKLYGLRWHVELDLRYLKAQMDAGQLEVHSASMARKQWLACLLAYNLIRAAMLCAALQQGISPLTLSFSASRRRLEFWLRDFGRTVADVLVSWERTLAEIGKCRLPKRNQPRPNEPRAKRRVPQSFPSLVGSRAQARDNSKIMR